MYPQIMKKIKGPIWYPVHPSPPHPTQLTPSNKTSSSFQKGLFTFVFLKPPEPFPLPIKHKLKTIGHLSLRRRIKNLLISLQKKTSMNPTNNVLCLVIK